MEGKQLSMVALGEGISKWSHWNPYIRFPHTHLFLGWMLSRICLLSSFSLNDAKIFWAQLEEVKVADTHFTKEKSLGSSLECNKDPHTENPEVWFSIHIAGGCWHLASPPHCHFPCLRCHLELLAVCSDEDTVTVQGQQQESKKRKEYWV